MRVIIRFSLDGDYSSGLRNKLQSILEPEITNDGNTGTWDGLGLTRSQVSQKVRTFWEAVDEHDGPGKLDHFWMYTEKMPTD